MNRNVRTGRHCIFELYCHMVFVPKYRKNVFTSTSLKLLQSYFTKVCTDFNCVLKEFNGEKDHVHCVVNYPPQVAISKLVNSMKGVSSRRLKKDLPVVKKYYWNKVFWSPSYCAVSCGGAPLEVIQQYIEKQRRPA